jgi:hypothetical protein
MLVRLHTTLCWAGYWSHSGDEVDLPDDLALRYIAAGSAEPITPPVETAALHTTPPKGRREHGRTTATRPTA